MSERIRLAGRWGAASALTCALLALAGCQAEVSDDALPTVAAGEPSVAQSMRELHDEMVAAYRRRDGNAVKKLYAKQPDALYFWSRQMTYEWSDLEKALDGLIGEAEEMRLTSHDFRAGGSGDTGWFASVYHVERDREDGSSWTVEGRWTMVARKIDGRWLIVHDHESFPVPHS